jgi:hypothetical protein
MTNTLKVYDNYEISPCKRYEEPDSPGKFYFEVCEPEEADVWTLYGHIDGEGVEAIGDFATREHAEETFQRITGIAFAGTREVAARLRAMHEGPKLLEALAWLATAAEDAAIDGITDEFNPECEELQTAFRNAREIIARATDQPCRGRAA